jgi:hypothetical protein
MTTKTNKIKVTLFIDEPTYREFQHNTSKYPRGITSFVLQHTLEKINLEYEATGRSAQLEFFTNS